MELYWEKLDRTTARAKVFGGWLVKTTEVRSFRDPGFWASPEKSSVSTSMCFVPDPEHQWGKN